MDLAPGYTYIHGLQPTQARTIMAACTTVGVNPRLVRTSDSGFIVPNEVADEVERVEQPEWAPKEAVF